MTKPFQDYARALELIRGLRPSGDPVLFIHDGDPIPKGRARSTRKGGHYTPARTREAQQKFAARWADALNGDLAFDGNLAIACVFFRATRITADGDNLMKLVADAGTDACVWRDDKQLTGWAYAIELDRKHPRTVVALARHQSTLTR